MHWALMELAIGGGDVSARSCDGPNVVVGVKAASRRFAVPLRGSRDSDCARWAGGWPSRRGRKEKGRMLEIHAVMLEVLGMMRPVLEEIGRHDRELESQARRASSSVVLNVAEGSGARGKNRIARYAIALGEARETMSCLQVAVAFGYIDGIDEHVARRMHRVIGTLVKVTR